MKRSEMVRLLYDHVYGHKPLSGHGIGMFSDLLTKIEEAGMLPPNNNPNAQCQEEECNDWDDEDE